MAASPYVQEEALPLDNNLIFRPINIALLTVSDSRTRENDTSGDILADRIIAAGHNIADRHIERDDTAKLTALLHNWIDNEEIDCIISTGGTGLTGRDITPEALDRVKTKDIPGFGELFRMLSFESIGTSTIQSRACAVLARGTYIFALPGSNGAVKDGWDKILVHQLDSRHKPCNFVELMPRLKEV
jgi:molybdopterin adenylyltransferase